MFPVNVNVIFPFDLRFFVEANHNNNIILNLLDEEQLAIMYCHQQPWYSWLITNKVKHQLKVIVIEQEENDYDSYRIRINLFSENDVWWFRTVWGEERYKNYEKTLPKKPMRILHKSFINVTKHSKVA